MSTYYARFWRFCSRWQTAARVFRGNEDGVSALEFGLVAPILFFSLVATADIGLAINERMTIDHILRAGAQSAIVDQRDDAILQVLESLAIAEKLPTLTVSVARYCACPNATSVAVACSTTCFGPASTFIFSRMSAQKDYDGMILPSFNLSRTMEVQVR